MWLDILDVAAAKTNTPLGEAKPKWFLGWPSFLCFSYFFRFYSGFYGLIGFLLAKDVKPKRRRCFWKG